jgi:hypothetical protein
MTAKKIGNYWVRQASPFLSVLPGDLQSTFIEPLANKLREARVDVRLGAAVSGLAVEGGRVTGAKLADGSALRGDAFVLAVPLEVARRFVDHDVLALDPSLGNMHLLSAEPMSALHVRFRRKIADIPREHVFFHGGAYGLSFIDVSQIWQGRSETTELSFIASNFAPLASLADADATRVLLDEARQYLPFDDADLDWTVLNSNLTKPLFINTIGAWPNRPSARTLAPNLYVAGDFVKNPIDLACMEGAVHSALQAARALLHAAGERDLPTPAHPPTYPRALLLLLRAGLFPAAAAAYLVARVTEAKGRRAPARTTHRQRVERGKRGR